MAPPRLPYRLKFGVFEVDLEASEVRKSGLRQKIAGQPFEVLRILLEHPQEVVTREDLRQRIWPEGTFVDYDLALKKAVNRLRTVLGDSAESPRFIETVPRRGYRFIAPVMPMDGAGATSPVVLAEPTPIAESVHPRGSGARRKKVLAALISGAAVILGLVVGLDLAGLRGRVLRMVGAVREPTQRIQSVAVLPLANLSGDPGQEYFSDGITDALITELAQVGPLRVISRTSSMRYKQTGKSLLEIARELHVDGIVEGTVQRSGNRVRISAQLIDVATDKHLWANSYERDVRDVFLLEREVTDGIASQVRAQIATRGESSAQPRALDRNALDAYLQGKYHLYMSEMRRDEELRKAGQFFQKAINIAPDFAPAYIGLADAHNSLFWPSSDDLPTMLAAAEKAVELDPNSSEAHRVMASAKYNDLEWAEAEEEGRRAIGLNPNNALAHAQLGYALISRGRLEESEKEAEIAQQLDPNEDHLSVVLYLRGDFDRCTEHLLRMLAIRSDNAATHWFLSRVYARQGMHAESVREVGMAMTLSGLPEFAPRVDRAFATAGWPGALRQLAREYEKLMASRQGYFPGVLGDVYMQLGEKDKALYWLDEGSKHPRMALSDPVLYDVNVDPVFAPLHSDPRFKVLLQRMGLSE